MIFTVFSVRERVFTLSLDRLSERWLGDISAIPSPLCGKDVRCPALRQQTIKCNDEVWEEL